ncbi:MAG TPA: Rieske 2Fe-2S domain-containing protein [Chloroflexota bacterium]|jgi:5,5'-dehydrodivanillate O-demethylase oxygenase subunit|nr:Rieske 2Fe-2S domain-containing protein [Chloroflexota bacterium]
MLTREENEALVRVGPGTPGGELLRRYWHPVAIAQELTDENPTMTVRILGETLVLFRDKSGRVGLLEDKCAHRNASLLYGRVEERGISCVYHGWLFDTEGNILETPPEKNDAILNHVKQTSYPVERFLGMYWAYLGPLPAPVIPHYDTFTRSDGKRSIVVHPDLDANWFQAMENSVDPAHLQVLHQEYIGRGRQPVNTTRGFTDDVKDFSFYVNDIGIMKHREYHNGSVEEHPLIFPNILRQGPSTQIRVPIDDEHTRHIHVLFEYTGKIEDNEADPPVEYLKPYKNPPDALHPFTRFDARSVLAQDHLAWETQGPIADRTREHLSYSDRGVALLRKVMFENMDKVKRGEDPLGVIRDPNHEMIDTNLVDGLFGADGRNRAGAPPTPDAAAVQSYRQ